MGWDTLLPTLFWRKYKQGAVWGKPALLVALTLGLLLPGLLWAPSAQAQRLRQLENVRLLSHEGREVLEFSFTSPVEVPPQPEFRPGEVALHFNATGSEPPVRTLNVKDSRFFNTIRITANRTSVTVLLGLINPEQSLQGQLEFFPQGQTVLMQVLAEPAASTPAGDETALASEMNQVIAGGSALPITETAEEAPISNLGAIQDDGFASAMLTMSLSLGLMVALLYLALWAYNKYLRGFFGSKNQAGVTSIDMMQLAQFHLGPKQRVVVMDIEGEIVALGVSPGNISYLTHLGGAGGASMETAPMAAAPAASRPASPKAAPKAPTASEPRKDPVENFAQTLKSKVGSLKKIK